MVYIIFNESYEWDDFCMDYPIIEYISSNKDCAFEYWYGHYGDVETRDNSKWHYKYCLCEYPDGWNRFQTKTIDGGYKTLKMADNFDDIDNWDNEKDL